MKLKELPCSSRELGNVFLVPWYNPKTVFAGNSKARMVVLAELNVVSVSDKGTGMLFCPAFQPFSVKSSQFLDWRLRRPINMFWEREFMSVEPKK